MKPPMDEEDENKIEKVKCQSERCKRKIIRLFFNFIRSDGKNIQRKIQWA